MSKLSAYIDNMFIGLPETDEVLEAKRIIQENMTEKYEDLLAQGKNEAEAFGTVAGEFGSMEELCDEMGWDFSRSSQGKGAIGYISVGFVNDEVKSLTVDGIAPTKQNVAKGTYPISRELHFFVKGKPTGLTKEFIAYVLSEKIQQSAIVDAGFIPVEGAEGGNE